MRKSYLHRLKKSAQTSVMTGAVLVMTALIACAHGEKNSTFNVHIDNFGEVNEHYFRGSQPLGDNYAELAAIGVKTIVDLRDDALKNSQSLAEQAGLKYINLPLSDKKYPAADAAGRFLQIVNDKENWPVFVHCAGGRHRTGAMTAVYRMTVDGWKVDQAYAEMKQYDFYTAWGHGDLKKYVFDYDSQR